MSGFVRVTITIEAALAVDPDDRESLAESVREGLRRNAVDADLILWLIDGGVVEAVVST